MNKLGKGRGLGILLGCAVVLGASTQFSMAEVQTFTNRSAWEAAVALSLNAPIVIEDFNALTPGNLPRTGITQIGLLTIETNDNPARRVDDGSDARNIDGSNFFLATVDGSPIQTFVFDFGQPVYAWAADYNQAFDPTRVTFSSLTQVAIGPQNSSGFAGYISTTPFTSVTFSSTNPSFASIGLDNVSFVAVPEPTATALLTIAGLIGLCGARRFAPRVRPLPEP